MHIRSEYLRFMSVYTDSLIFFLLWSGLVQWIIGIECKEGFIALHSILHPCL